MRVRNVRTVHRGRLKISSTPTSYTHLRRKNTANYFLACHIEIIPLNRIGYHASAHVSMTFRPPPNY
ncbi:hypothetical protein EUGRSUZ_B03098 [Eucalyptus grandis]|uniref:Uncharacterized protein n=2 Tax=Eucalyptus grandis TaxID=71139 RepID=A0ACC3LV89_EUCGR|nr:hypothetical protein EUGRSUZ_B03098 [Eucalyptus grandis]